MIVIEISARKFQAFLEERVEKNEGGTPIIIAGHPISDYETKDDGNIIHYIYFKEVMDFFRDNKFPFKVKLL